MVANPEVFIFIFFLERSIFIFERDTKKVSQI